MNYDNIRFALSRIRNQSFPSQPKSRIEIVLQTNYQTINGHDFLIANDGLENKILTFGTSDRNRNFPKVK